MKKILTLLLVFVMVMQISVFCVSAAEEEITLKGIDYSAGTPSQVSDSGLAMVHLPNPLGWKVSLPYKSNAIKLTYRTASTEYGVLNIRLGSASGEIIGTVETDKIANAWADYTNVIYLTKPIQGDQTIWITTSKGTIGKGGAHWIRYITFLQDSGAQAFAVLEEKDVYKDIKDDQNAHEINMLTDLGVFSDSDTSFMPSKPMTRTEFICALGKLIGAEQYGTEVSPFKDIEAETEECKFLSGLYQMGIIRGDTEGNFRPGSFISPTEASIVCLNALGYEGFSKDPNVVMDIANTLDLFDGITFTNKVTKSQAAKLIYNLLLADYLAVNEMSDKDIFYNPTKNYLEKATNYKHAKGIVTANAYTRLYAPKRSEGISIDGVSYKLGDGVNGSYLGVYCEFFYHEENGERILDVIRPMPKAEWKYVESTTDINFSEISERKIEYTVLSEDEEYEYELDAQTAIIYNGVALTKSLAALISNPQNFEGGITIIDNNSDDVIDTIWIDHANRVIEVGFVSKGRFIDNLAENPEDATYDTTKKQFVAYKDGRNALVDEFMPGDIITLYESAETGKDQLVRAIADENAVVGTISGYANGKYTIGDTEYRVSPYCQDELYVGLSGNFLLDKYDFIVACEEEAASELMAGLYLSNDCGEPTALETVARVKILTSAGIEEITIAPKVVADGVTIKTVEDFYNGKGAYAGITNVDANSPVLYRLNSKNQIVIIDTINDGTYDRNDQLTNLFSANLEVDRQEQEGSGPAPQVPKKNTVYKEQCVIYVSAICNIDRDGSTARIGCDTGNVTAITMSSEAGSEKNWKIRTNPNIDTDNKYTKVAPYSFTRGSMVADLLILVDHPGYTSTYIDPIVIDKISMGLDAEGNATKKLHGYSSTAEVTYTVNADNYASKADFKERIDALKEGYLVSLSLESNEVVDARIVFVPKTGERLGATHWGEPQDSSHETMLNTNKRMPDSNSPISNVRLMEFVDFEQKFIKCIYNNKWYVFDAKASSVTICEKNPNGTYTFSFGMPVSSLIPEDVLVARRGNGGILGSIFAFRDNSQ